MIPPFELTGAHVFVAGGAGFVGSSIVRRLLKAGVARVRVADNFKSGSRQFLGEVLDDPRLDIAELDIKDRDAVIDAMEGFKVVVHLASNPDIAAAMADPTIDFWEGTYLTQNVLEAMRIKGAETMIYASGSGVYGDSMETPCPEDMGSLHPISTYGASKLAGEALISSYCHMFGMSAAAFRFANLVGPRQTHGVAFDFIRKLMQSPDRLHILGDGRQSKSYLHVEDAISAMLTLPSRDAGHFECFNIGTGDYITVREIADVVVEAMGLDGVVFDFAGGNRGWKGDVPIVRLDTAKALGRGWKPTMTSLESIRASVRAMLGELGYAAQAAV